MKRRITKTLIIIGYLIGFSVLLYPTISNFINEQNASRVVTNYDTTIANIADAQKEQMLKDAHDYNNALIGNGIVDPFESNTQTSANDLYDNLLSINTSGMMGYVTIPKINVELPIYHGTGEAVLQTGVGHLEGSSLPVGGDSTHAVLTGHRGLPSADLFTEIDQLENGDIFYINVLNDTLAYQVDQVLTVLPSELEALNIVEGEDHATLITCTPYAVNTHRLLVRGTRIPYIEATKVAPNEVSKSIPYEFLLLGIGLVLLVVILFVVKKLKKGKGDK